MDEIAYQLQHSVEVEASLDFVWGWQTDVRNWDDPPAQFQLDGPFAAGASGSTMFPGQPSLRWRIREARPLRAYIIDMPLDQATCSFEWEFDPLSERRTKLTQRIVLCGANAAAYVPEVRAGFGSTLAGGMERIARAIAKAEESTRSAG
jgi:polyketide cyclase/dehydrase/lipid transport protein